MLQGTFTVRMFHRRFLFSPRLVDLVEENGTRRIVCDCFSVRSRRLERGRESLPRTQARNLLVSVWCLFLDGTGQTPPTRQEFMEWLQVPAGRKFNEDNEQAQTLTRN